MYAIRSYYERGLPRALQIQEARLQQVVDAQPVVVVAGHGEAVGTDAHDDEDVAAARNNFV